MDNIKFYLLIIIFVLLIFLIIKILKNLFYLLVLIILLLIILRFKSNDGLFFDYVIPSNYYPNSISINGIGSYNFSINPNEFNPSGFFNFNEIKYATLNLILNNDKINKNNIFNSNLSIRVYAFNYNILRFYYGRAVLALNI